MAPRLRLLVCENFRMEAQALLRDGAHADIQLGFFPARCGQAPLRHEELLPLLQDSTPAETLLLGGSCLSNVQESGCRVISEPAADAGDCAHLICQKEIVQPFLDQGAKLITPSWLRRWHDAQAPDEQPDPSILEGLAGARRLVLLDSGVDADSRELLNRLRTQTDLPVERVAVGIDYARLYLAERIRQWRAGHNEVSEDPDASPADYAVALELLSDLPLARTEAVLVRRLFDIARLLFGASRMHYLSVQPGQPDQFWAFPAGTEPGDGTRARLEAFRGAAERLEAGTGFLLRMGLDPRLGVAQIEGIADPARIPHYMRLAFVIGRVVAYAIQSMRASRQAQQMAATLAHERDLLRILLDSIPDSIYFKDRQSRFTRVNRAQATLLGLKDESEALGKTDFDFLSNEFARQAYYDEQLLMESGKPLLAKLERVEGNHFSRWMTATKVPVFDATGKASGLVGISRDITDWKEAQDQLKRSDESLRMLFATIPHAVWVYDLETMLFLLVNDAAVRHYGFSTEEFLGMSVLAIHSDQEAARLEALLRGQDTPCATSGEWTHRTRDGKTVDVEVGAAIFDFHGRPAVLAISQDITDRKRMQAELQQAQKLESVGSLAAGIAHEINTPIQFVGDSIHFLKEVFDGITRVLPLYEEIAREHTLAAGPTPATRHAAEVSEEIDIPFLMENVPDSFERCLEGVDRVAKIVRAMKSFAHPDQREARPADINNALQDTLIIARNEYKLVADVVTGLADLPPVHCHIGDLNQVFLNLIVNASHAIADVVGKSGGRGTIRVATRVEGSKVLVEIADTGGGIPESIRDRVFDPFFTTKTVGQGTGQGLAIARSIVVDSHGGTIQFESKEGVGTTFLIRLPIQGKNPVVAV